MSSTLQLSFLQILNPIIENSGPTSGLELTVEPRQNSNRAPQVTLPIGFFSMLGFKPEIPD